MASSSERFKLDLAEVLPRDSSIAEISAPGGDVVALDDEAEVFLDVDGFSSVVSMFSHDLGTFPPRGEILAALSRA